MMAYTNTERKRAYERVYQRERRAMLAAHRLCYACKQQDARTLEGYVYCAACREKYGKRRRKYDRKRIPDASGNQPKRLVEDPESGEVSV